MKSFRALLGLVSIYSLSALAQDKSSETNALWLAEHYTKYEYRIPMRRFSGCFNSARKSAREILTS